MLDINALPRQLDVTTYIRNMGLSVFCAILRGSHSKGTKPDLHANSPMSREPNLQYAGFFFWLGAAWVKSRAERPSVSGVNRQLHVQIGCKLVIRNRKDELTKQAKRSKLQIKPEGN